MRPGGKPRSKVHELLIERLLAYGDQAVVIGTVESVMARLRLVRIPQLLVAATILAAFSTLLVIR